MSKKTILFVDDDPIALQLVMDEFRKVFANTVRYERATTAEEAEELIMEEMVLSGRLPAIIVCDWMMPGKKGDQFMKEVKEMYPEISLILHSGLANKAEVERIEDSASLLCSLPKPWDGKTYVDRIFKALSAA
ncbi:MAG: response regulator [Bacteroidota bacterium]